MDSLWKSEINQASVFKVNKTIKGDTKYRRTKWYCLARTTY